MDRFIVKQSDQPGWWVVQDLQSGVVLRFQEHMFNETQDITMTEPMTDVTEMARVMREIGDYISTKYYNIAF